MRLCIARSRARPSLQAWPRYRSSSHSCSLLGLQSPRATSRAACLLEGGAVSRRVERASHGPRALLPRQFARASVRKARLQCITSRRAKVRSSGERASRSERGGASTSDEVGRRWLGNASQGRAVMTAHYPSRYRTVSWSILFSRQRRLDQKAASVARLFLSLPGPCSVGIMPRTHSEGNVPGPAPLATRYDAKQKSEKSRTHAGSIEVVTKLRQAVPNDELMSFGICIRAPAAPVRGPRAPYSRSSFPPATVDLVA